MKLLRTAAMRIFILMICLTAAIFAAAPGDLDPTFGAGGKVLTHLPFQAGLAKQVEVQPDGKILALTGHSLVRYNSDGTLDTSFGYNNSGSFGAKGNGFVILPNGKLLHFGLGGQGGYAPLLISRNADGTLDFERYFSDIAPGFTFASRPGGTESGKILVQPNGKIIIFGQIREPNSWLLAETAAIRLNSDGTLDTAFGVNGVFKNQNSIPSATTVHQIGLQPDGKILFSEQVLIYQQQAPVSIFRLGRLNPNGTLDTSFIDPGDGLLGGSETRGFISIYTKSISSNTFAIQPDGKIIVVTRTIDYRSSTVLSKVTRYLPNGRVGDSSFGGGGAIAFAPQPGSQFDLTSILVQPNGKIIVGGTKLSGASRHFVVLRLTRFGELDRTFGADGFAIAAFRGVNDFLNALAFQPDGKIVALGDIAVSLFGAYDIGLARFLNNASAQPAQFDFDGDSKSDFSVFRLANALWRYLNSSTGSTVQFPWGLSTDTPVSDDYDGDGKTDFAVFRGGAWYIYGGSVHGYVLIQLGQAGDTPVPADYDGDRRADTAVFSAGIWHIRQSTNNQVRIEHFGLPTDKPVLGDFDGDGKNDLAVYRDGTWFIKGSTAGFFVRHFGLSTDKPVAADYDADGKTDFAVFRAGVWYLQQSTAGFAAMQFGLSSDIPVPADYDGDGRADIAVFRAGFWYAQLSASNSFRAVQFGDPNDMPIPSIFLP